MNEPFTKKVRLDADLSKNQGDYQAIEAGVSRNLRSRVENHLLRKLLRVIGDPPIAVNLWDGRTIASPGVEPRWQISVGDRRTLRKLLFDPLFEFGEAYSEGRLDAVGDLAEMLTAIHSCMMSASIGHNKMHRLLRCLRKPRSNSLAGSRKNIFHHYDISNEFYQKWLDQDLVYTCAYFEHPAMTLEEAQYAKLDLVCRKLRLRPGATVFEAGCGWGALALHMARYYDVKVRAVNISKKQIEFARRRCSQLGLTDQVEFVLDDWRSLSGRCDVFVSIGMLEHVGVKNYQRFGQVIRNCLEPSGLALIHTIGQNAPQPLGAWTERRIFPGAYPPALSEITQALEPFEFSILDVENLRLHYAQTLRHWADRYEQSVDWVREQMDERFVRMWRLYLKSSIAAFQSGALQLFQILFAHGGNQSTPLLREDIYRPAELPRSEQYDKAAIEVTHSNPSENSRTRKAK